MVVFYSQERVNTTTVPYATTHYDADASGVFLSWALGLFHTYFYNHARHLRLEKLQRSVISRAP